MKRTALLAVLLTAVLAAGAATAVAAPSSVFGSSGPSQAAGPALGNVSVKYKVGKFVKSGRSLLAKGTVTATYTPLTGTPTTVTQPFTAKATFSRKWRIASTGSEQRICQVLTLQLALYGVLYARKRVSAFRRPLIVYALALALCSPWLLYTYAVSGRAFYWASSGGMSLYWMSSPYPDELGDWHGDREVFETPSLARHHGAFFHELEGLSDFERDDALRARAISNITANPAKFADNVLSNIGRMLFGSPFTNKRQSTDYLRYLLPNAAVAALVAFCAVPTYLGRRRLPPEVLALLLFSGSAFAATGLLSAYARHFAVLLPSLGLWLVYTLSQLVRIETSR